MLIDLLIVLLLMILNGVFAMTELAVVSSRRSKLLSLAESGSRGAKIVLDLKEHPNKFLSIVQIGITLTSILSGAFSGATLAGPIGAYLDTLSLLKGHGDDIAIAVVVAGVTYFSLIVGELVPKQIALKYADSVAIFIAVPIYWSARVLRPLVIFLDASSRIVLRLLRIPTETSNAVSEEEVKAIIAEGAETGVFAPEEQKMMEGVLRLSDLSIKATMTHRQDIVWLEVGEGIESVTAKIKESQHSHYLLCEKSRQNVLGIVSTKDMVVQLHEQGSLNLTDLVRETISLPEMTNVHDAISAFRNTRAHVALVIDEYGSLEGIITFKDILEAIVGLMPEPNAAHSHITRREDGSLLLDGLLPIYEAESLLEIKNMENDSADFSTLAGFILHHLKRLPKEGDVLKWNNIRFEIMDMDGRRIDKVLVSALPASPEA